MVATYRTINANFIEETFLKHIKAHWGNPSFRRLASYHQDGLVNDFGSDFATLSVMLKEVVTLVEVKTISKLQQRANKLRKNAKAIAEVHVDDVMNELNFYRTLISRLWSYEEFVISKAKFELLKKAIKQPSNSDDYNLALAEIECRLITQKHHDLLGNNIAKIAFARVETCLDGLKKIWYSVFGTRIISDLEIAERNEFFEQYRGISKCLQTLRLKYLTSDQARLVDTAMGWVQLCLVFNSSADFKWLGLCQEYMHSSRKALQPVLHPFNTDTVSTKPDQLEKLRVGTTELMAFLASNADNDQFMLQELAIKSGKLVFIDLLQKVYWKGKCISKKFPSGKSSYKTLKALVKKDGLPITRDDILTEEQKEQNKQTRGGLSKRISTLRKKLPKLLAERIVTVTGVGYQINLEGIEVDYF
jgi:hypothetical protein